MMPILERQIDNYQPHYSGFTRNAIISEITRKNPGGIARIA